MNTNNTNQILSAFARELTVDRENAREILINFFHDLMENELLFSDSEEIRQMLTA